MNIVHQEGLAMPVDQELINIILNEAEIHRRIKPKLQPSVCYLKT